jgi:hypothetical protein
LLLKGKSSLSWRDAVMWKKIGLIGRDNLLKKQIRPRLLSRKGLVLTGDHGVGKTAVLQWCYDQTEGEKSFISATWTTKNIMQAICKDWGLEVQNGKGEVVENGKALIPWMEISINKVKGNWLFIDDIHKATPALLLKLKPIRDKCQIVCTALMPIKKDELKRMLWGLRYIEIKPLPGKDMVRIANEAALHISTNTPIPDAVHASRGRPSHLFHALRGEVTPDNAKTPGEEIDLSPMLLIFFAFLMASRYIARSIDSPSMVLLSGCGMGIGLIARFFLFKGMRK